MNTQDLEKYRQIQDPLADALVAKIISENDILAVNQLMSGLTRNSDVQESHFPDGIGKLVMEYMEKTAPMPSWAKPESIKMAQEMFTEFGMSVAMLLNLRSLPMTYACAKGAEVLYRTGLLTAKEGKVNLVRRIMETAQFVIYTMEKGGLEPDGKGIVTAQKIRLIHACIRVYLHQQNWDAEKYGQPINKQDEAGTLLAFGALVIEGLEMTGYTFTTEQKDAYVHTWNVIGHWMGVDEALMAQNYEDALTLGYQIFGDQQAESEAGIELASALMDMIYDQTGFWMRPFLPGMIRYYITDATADLLKIRMPCIFHDKFLMKILSFFSKELQALEQHSKIIRWIMEKLTIALLQTLTVTYNQNKSVQFYLPSYLTEGADALYKENNKK
jgi:hypothetical protein